MKTKKDLKKMRAIISKTLFILFLLQPAVIFAYDYQTVYSHRTLYFLNSFSEIEAVKIDSVRLQQTDSIIYPFKGLQLTGDNCFSPNGFIWLGQKIIISKDRNYFFNETGDTIKIFTTAKLNDVWEVFRKNDITITGTITSIKPDIILGKPDSVKTITLHVFKAGIPDTWHQSEGKTIEIGKKTGLISAVNFLYFPSPQYSNNSSIMLSLRYILAGMNSPESGVKNFTWFEAFDFQPGDEFHYRYNDSYMASYANHGISIMKILERKDYIPDSIVYMIENIKVDTLQTFISTAQGWSKNIVNNHYISKSKIYPNPVFDAFPGFFTQNKYSDLEYYPMYIDNSKSYFLKQINKISDNCWNDNIIDDACNGSIVRKGLGITFTYSGCWDELGSDKEEMVYYKKGDTTWGTPVSYNYFQESFAPKGTEWYYNEEIFNIYGGVPPDSDYTLLSSVGDTIIENIPCNHIKKTRGHTQCDFYEDGYFYENKDTVFFYSPFNQRFCPIYIWSARAGDKWVINYSADKQYDVEVTVDSIDFILLSGKYVRKQFLTYRSVSMSDFKKNVAVIENIGDPENLYSFNFVSMLICDDLLIRLKGLRCYVQPQFGTYKTSETECYYRTTGIKEIKKINLLVSPNPVKEMLKISLDEPITTPVYISVISCQGEIVYRNRLINNEENINVKGLSKGVYLLRIEKNGVFESIRFIKD